MRTSQVQRSQQYTYFLNKSIHYDHLKNIKAVVSDRRHPNSYRYSIDEDGFSRNRKLRKTIERSRDIENEKMIDRIVNIMQSPRCEVEVQGDYSKLHQVRRDFLKIKKNEIERIRDIDISNSALHERLQRVKPLVGNVHKWNNHYEQYKRMIRNSSKFGENSSRKSKLELHGPYLPKSLSQALGQEQLKSMQSKKRLSLDYERMFALPTLTARSRKAGGSSMATIQVSPEEKKQQAK